MEKLKQQQEKYKGRINRFMGYLTQIDPLWITKRSWFDDLKNFELGDSFYYKVFFVDDTVSSPEDKSNFYFGILLFASINFKRKIRSKQEDLESGFEIESDIDDELEKEVHETLLGYFWWLAIYKHAHKAKQFSEAEEAQLEKKRKAFMIRFNRIEAID